MNATVSHAVPEHDRSHDAGFADEAAMEPDAP